MINTNLKDLLFLPSFETGKTMISKLSPDRLLAPCFEAMGLTPPSERYGGWEARGISGHTLGHYMSALSYLYRYNKDQEAYTKAVYCTDKLAEIQSNNGFIAGFPEKDSFDNVFKDPDNFKAEGFELGGWWVPYYSLHKIFRGLIDIYENLEYSKALDVATKLGNWVYETTSTLNEEQRLRLLKCEYGGMNDVLARLYMVTGNKNHLKAAEFFTEEKILNPLSEGTDMLSKLHANTQIPKIIGFMSLYEATKDEKYLAAGKNFFDFVVNNRSYAIGGHSIGEHFEEHGKETLATNTCETCNTNNMFQLAMKLWNVKPDATYFDFIEKALYNHILASQDETGMKTYFVGLKPGNHKVYSTPEDSFWCCFGSGLENPFNYSSFIFTSYNNKLYINLFVESENEYITLKKAESDKYIAEIKIDLPSDICIRVPDWCNNFSVSKSGKCYDNIQNGYIVISDVSAGDKLCINIPSEIKIHNKKDDKNTVYFTYGHTVLAERIDENLPEDDHAAGENDMTNQECPELSPIKSTKVLKTGELKFKVDGHILVPFYSIIHGRYRIYFETK